MENSPLPLLKWFRCIYFLTTSKGISSIDLARNIGVRQHTAWHMMQRLSAAIASESDTILSGIVEIDEAFVGPEIGRNTRLQAAKNKHNKEQNRIHGLSKDQKRAIRGYPIKGHRQKGVTKEVIEQRKKEKEHFGKKQLFRLGFQVLGMMEREGKVVFRVVGKYRSDINQKNIVPHLINHISKESCVITDEHRAYHLLNGHFKTHHIINHRECYVKTIINEDGDKFKVHTNGIENVWKNLKKMIRGKHVQFSVHHAKRYLDMFAYRWNRRKQNEIVLFEDFIPNLFDKRFKYEDLTCQGHNKNAA